jgi:hypothetical protein
MRVSRLLSFKCGSRQGLDEHFGLVISHTPAAFSRTIGRRQFLCPTRHHCEGSPLGGLRGAISALPPCRR